MARTSGSNNFAGTLEILASSALDARDIVQTKADLTASGSFPYPYVGMETYVIAENKKYRLIADDPTDLDNWEEVGGGGSIDVELTQDEYDALPASKETDGINYFVKDGVPASQRIVETGFTPVGTVISVMGTTAPQHYLACDGTAVNIADYPVLAAYFEEQFGSSNFFGGDGETTFALPDLRGEFLRGTGTNSHANQGSGANVGVHQDGTEIPTIISSGNNNQPRLLAEVTDQPVFINNKDGAVGNQSTVGFQCYNSSTWTLSDPEKTTHFTSRPTNTSVLYCIATKNIYVDARFDYSLDEKVVGTWIDGSTLYQKTVALTNIQLPASGAFTDIPLSSDTNLELKNSFGFLETSGGYMETIPLDSMDRTKGTAYYTVRVRRYNNSITLCLINHDGSSMTFSNIIVTIQYTKTTT